MKKTLSFLFLSILILSAFTFEGGGNSPLLLNNVVIKFEGTNGNGNNLWLDNFSIGVRYGNDLTISSMSLRDKNYLLPGVSSTNISPVVTVFNTGRSTSSDATITMVDGGSYNVTKNVGSVAAGATIPVTFDPMIFNLSTTKNLKVYINWVSDQNHGNDTLYQPTTFYAGVNKKILFEAHTSTTCAPCASQNPALDLFVQERFDSIVPIKYHVWWPALGDPMYGLNIPQARVRTHYNSISAVPTLQIDGVLQQVSNYTTLSNLLTPYNNRRALASPIAITVTDTRLPGDTIKAIINVQIVSLLPSNIDYRLRVVGLERTITYSTPPGSNGETVFHDVFRRMYPSTNGIQINTAVGNYVYEVRYKRESVWIDSMMYSAVLIQDENTHEVINCNKSRNFYDNAEKKLQAVSDNSMEKSSPLLTETPAVLVSGGIQVETMEKTVPPLGWSIINSDSNFTFWQYIYTAVNGPSFPGEKSIRINYYSYPENVGTVDILKSKVYDNVNLNDTIRFDWAYALRPGFTNDKLVVKLSTDGGATFPFTVFDKQGSALATAPDLSSSFVPTASQWSTFTASVSSVTSVEPGITGTPAKYELFQNYPNPFNPVTKISYSIPIDGIITLKVFDILGKEVAILFNDRKVAGNYSVDFNATNFSSGVYFYKLEVNNYTDIKRMVLVK